MPGKMSSYLYVQMYYNIARGGGTYKIKTVTFFYKVNILSMFKRNPSCIERRKPYSRILEHTGSGCSSSERCFYFPALTLPFQNRAKQLFTFFIVTVDPSPPTWFDWRAVICGWKALSGQRVNSLRPWRSLGPALHCILTRCFQWGRFVKQYPRVDQSGTIRSVWIVRTVPSPSRVRWDARGWIGSLEIHEMVAPLIPPLTGKFKSHNPARRSAEECSTDSHPAYQLLVNE